MYDSVEINLLLCCLTSSNQPAINKHIQTIVQSEINWDYLITTATRHGVMPPLCHRVTKICPEIIPDKILVQLQNYLQVNTTKNLRLTRELCQILTLFTNHNILALPFKGVVLAAAVYGDLGLRQVTDLDILVRDRDFDKAKDVLIAKGYQLKVQVPWECHLLRQNGLYNIDLHRDIVPSYLGNFANFDWLWKQAKCIVLGDQKIPSLPPEILLLIICLNGSKECWCSLKRISDLAQLIDAYPTLDWSKTQQLAKQFGLRRLVYIGLQLTQSLLKTSLPKNIDPSLYSDRVANAIVVEIKSKLFLPNNQLPREVEKTLFHIHTREHWRDKGRSLIGIMSHSGWLKITNNDREFIHLPEKLFWLYYLLRPWRILKKYGFKVTGEIFRISKSKK